MAEEAAKENSEKPTIEKLPRSIAVVGDRIPLIAETKYRVYFTKDQIANTSESAIALQSEIASLQRQVRELQQITSADDRQVSLQQIEKSIDTAVAKSADLTANIILPPQSMTDVHLVPTHSLERFVEYKADENIAYLLTGLFAGAAISVLVNWATDDSFNPNAMSTTLLILFTTMALLSIGWIIRTSFRIKKVAAVLQEKDSGKMGTAH